MKILVLDTETSSLYADDGRVVEISIVEADLMRKHISKIYDSVVGYNTDNWELREKKAWIFKNSTLTIEDVNKAKSIEKVAKEVRNIIRGNKATSYNVEFDFNNFLSEDPWNISNAHLRKGSARYELLKEGNLEETEYLDYELMPCIMARATKVCDIPHYYYGRKFATLDEAADILKIDKLREKITYDEELRDLNDRHRALYDCLQGAEILLALHERGEYII